METPINNGRDPVSHAIERLLRGLEAAGKGSLVEEKKDSLIGLQFGDFSVIAETYEIALIRLAAVMIENAEYTEVFVEALREPMHTGPGVST